METAQIGGTAKGGIRRLTLTDHDREVRDWFRSAMRGAGLHRDGRPGRQHVRARPGQKSDVARRSPWASISTPSRPAASSTAFSACSAASRPCAPCTTSATRPTRPLDARQLDQRGGLALRAGDARLGRLCRRVHARLRRQPRRTARAATFGEELERIGYRGEAARRLGQVRRHVRAAYRAGADPRGRAEGDRRRHRRAGHALVRGRR